MPKRKPANTPPKKEPEKPKISLGEFIREAEDVFTELFRQFYTPGAGPDACYIRGEFFTPLFGDRTLESYIEAVAGAIGEKIGERATKAEDLELERDEADSKVTALEADVARLTEEVEAEKRVTDTIKENYQRLEEWETRVLAHRKARAAKRTKPIRER